MFFISLICCSGNIIQKYNLVKPRVDTNLGAKKPTKKELEKWKIKRAKRMEARKKRKKVVSTKRKRYSGTIVEWTIVLLTQYFRRFLPIFSSPSNMPNLR